MPNDIQLDPIDVNTISSDKVLTPEETIAVKESLSGKIIPVLTPIKNDYVDDKNRGTVEFKPVEFNQQDGRIVKRFGNYSLHKTIIPDGTIIKEVNFAQDQPHTVAIEGKNLTFIGCNLANVEIDPSWTLIETLNLHQRFITFSENGRDYIIQEIERDGVFIENARRDITPIQPK